MGRNTTEVNPSGRDVNSGVVHPNGLVTNIELPLAMLANVQGRFPAGFGFGCGGWRVTKVVSGVSVLELVDSGMGSHIHIMANPVAGGRVLAE